MMKYDFTYIEKSIHKISKGDECYFMMDDIMNAIVDSCNQHDFNYFKKEIKREIPVNRIFISLDGYTYQEVECVSQDYILEIINRIPTFQNIVLKVVEISLKNMLKVQF